LLSHTVFKYAYKLISLFCNTVYKYAFYSAFQLKTQKIVVKLLSFYVKKLVALA